MFNPWWGKSDLSPLPPLSLSYSVSLLANSDSSIFYLILNLTTSPHLYGLSFPISCLPCSFPSLFPPQLPKGTYKSRSEITGHLLGTQAACATERGTTRPGPKIFRARGNA